MRKNKLINRIVYVAMAACLLFNFIPVDRVGVYCHAMVGTLFVVLTVIHIVLNKQYFVSCLKNLFSNKLAMKAKVHCIVSVLMIVWLVMMMISGSLYAHDFTAFIFGVENGMRVLHCMTAFQLCILIIVHVFLQIRSSKK